MMTLKSYTLLLSLLLTGLSAGLFYAWTVSVIPGTQRVSDTSYLETMQSINRAILNPVFFASFFGPILALATSTFQYYSEKLPFWLLLVATLLYLFGTFGVTALGNVPLNDQLDLLELAELEAAEARNFRLNYEQRWNRFHLVRTVTSIATFCLALLAALIK